MTILKLILIYLFGFLGTYFLTAFYELDLNFMNWSSISRLNVIFMGFVPFFLFYNNKN